jgi:hypothetical protein
MDPTQLGPIDRISLSLDTSNTNEVHKILTLIVGFMNPLVLLLVSGGGD